jgi:7-keto-8-aminopelargonate synthetase-like enzyme
LQALRKETKNNKSRQTSTLLSKEKQPVNTKKYAKTANMANNNYKQLSKMAKKTGDNKIFHPAVIF